MDSHFFSIAGSFIACCIMDIFVSGYLLQITATSMLRIPTTYKKSFTASILSSLYYWIAILVVVAAVPHFPLTICVYVVVPSFFIILAVFKARWDWTFILWLSTVVTKIGGFVLVVSLILGIV